MEYRGMDYAIVQTIPKGWRWSVVRDRSDKVGWSIDRAEGIARAKTFIDKLIKKRRADSAASLTDHKSAEP
jgi:hypothetical protein